MDGLKALSRTLLALATIFVCCSCNGPSIEVIVICADNLSADIRGFEALSAQCPELESAFLELKLDAAMQPGWKSSLNRGVLQEFVELMNRSADAVANVPEVKKLQGVLDAIAREQPEDSPSWWDTFTRWLRSWLGSHEIKSVPWLDKLLQ